MSESNIEQLRQKDARDLSDEEVLELLKNNIETKGEVPTSRDLRGDSPWSVTESIVERAAGSINNALWLLGEEPKQETQVVDGDTEIVEHELRGLEHELGRPPLSSEGRGVFNGYDEEFRKEAGIPYHTLAARRLGAVNPEREDELVKMLFVDQKDPAILKRNNEAQHRGFNSDEKAAGLEISLISEAYLPWVDETAETRQDESGYEIDSAKEFSGVVFELVGEEGLSQRQIAAELDVERKKVQEVFSFLKNEQLIETEYGGPDGQKASGRSTFLTEQGRELLASDEYESLFYNKEIDIPGFRRPYNQQGEEFPGEFNHERTAEILELLAEGYETQKEIAEELGYAAGASLQPYIEELKQYGLINSGGTQGTWLTKRGEEVYEQHIEGDSKDLAEESLEDELEPDGQVVTDDLDQDLGNIETLADVYSALGTEASIEIFDLLNQGHSRQEIAEETGRSYGSLQNYMDKYKELGWIESAPGKGTEVTEVGEFFYKKLLQDDSVMDFVYDE